MPIEDLPGDREWGSGADPWAAGSGHLGELVRRWGGVATTQQLRQAVGRHGVETAAAAGTIRRVTRGRWVLASTAEDRGLAHAAGGVLSHTSAAHWHGWPVLSADQRVHVTVPRGSRARQRTFPEVVLHWADLTLDEVNDSITSRNRTLVDCLRTLDLRIALSVADSALREGYGADELIALASGLRGRGAGRARRVAAATAAPGAAGAVVRRRCLHRSSRPGGRAAGAGRRG